MADTQEDDLKDTLDVNENSELKDTPQKAPKAKKSTVMPAASEPTAPVAEKPATPAAAPVIAPHHANTPGVVVLQWLTYAFWGWLILGLIWLVSVILINAILKESVSEVVPYAIAASIVLLPIAFVTDLLYRKHEPVKKTGAAMLIMVIHAVIFALFGIGALITAAFVGLNAAINMGDTINAQIVGFLTAVFAAILYVAAFARTLNPFKSKKPQLIYSFGMLGLSILLLIFAVVGPVIQSVISRNDKLIEQNLISVQRGVNDYISENKALPKSLDDINLTNKGAKELVTKDLVEFVPGTTQSTTALSELSITTTYRYELCVTFASASNASNSYYDDSMNSDDYKSYLYVYSHDAGRQCYKLKGTTYENTINSITNKSSPKEKL
jgi:hypothetical protein